ncbi:uncharacterized protein PADG_11194 [Paracoccidioides brasiliensis Pb18]|uniref:Uncharacterized protein n=1 Tax=Paracoccidioides brasiliensis (strain Pb18) TaxID=502780 RepID=A0A0A0HXG3_PARBD|nr:uncharacterized protein PADG_11194 [Paracoccidioides brasiliensis Pb18]KGM92736.1 hypothetical protein PADG_11194 [Paracoccidioides brasiliensis Pb18]
MNAVNIRARYAKPSARQYAMFEFGASSKLCHVPNSGYTVRQSYYGTTGTVGPIWCKDWDMKSLNLSATRITWESVNPEAQYVKVALTFALPIPVLIIMSHTIATVSNCHFPSVNVTTYLCRLICLYLREANFTIPVVT